MIEMPKHNGIPDFFLSNRKHEKLNREKYFIKAAQKVIYK